MGSNNDGRKEQHILTIIAMTKPTIASKLLQQQKKISTLFLGGGYLGLCFLGVLGVTFFLQIYFWGLFRLLFPRAFGCSLFFFLFFRMALFLRPLSVQNTPCLHCSGLYISSDVSRHVKSVHPFDNLIPQTNHAIFSLYVSVLHVFFLGSIPLYSWGWLQT